VSSPSYFQGGRVKRKRAAHKNSLFVTDIFFNKKVELTPLSVTLSLPNHGDCSIQETGTKMRETSQYEQGRVISIQKRNNNKDFVVQTAVHNLKLKYNIKARHITLRRYLEERTSRIKSFQALF
jgi:hypothetical protein